MIFDTKRKRYQKMTRSASDMLSVKACMTKDKSSLVEISEHLQSGLTSLFDKA